MTIDFHSHILPGADHGSKNLETSICQLMAAKQHGIDIVAATPHFYANMENVSEFLSRRESAYNELLPSFSTEFPHVLLGSEVLLFTGMENMAELDKLTLQGTNCLLLEMPYTSWDNKLTNTLDKICSSGNYTVILAHIDRYSNKQLSILEDMDLYFQINVSSLCNLFTRIRLERYTNSGKVIALGSDIHGSSAKPYVHFERISHKMPVLFDDVMKQCADLLIR